jgi:hypothetical protein
MKKLIAIAFTCVYLTLTVGVVHATHYCMGRVDSTTLFSFESDKCLCELFAAAADRSCCDDEVNLIKIVNDQTGSTPLSISPEFFSMWENHFSIAAERIIVNGPTFLTNHDKPPGKEIPLFVQHCSLILYSDADLA